MTSNHVIELIPEYALGNLEPAEFQEVQRHLDSCATCTAELQAYQDVLGQIALTTPMITPPSRLKAQILETIQPVKTTEPQPAPKPTTARTGSWFQNLLQRLAPVGPTFALINIALLVVLVTTGVFMAARFATIPDTGTFRLVRFNGTDAAQGATGLMTINADGEVGTLVVDGLPPLEAGKQYQLWLIRNGVRTSGGLFTVSNNGYGVLKVEAPEPLIRYPSFGVTIEPSGGSPGPTGPKVLGGNL